MQKDGRSNFVLLRILALSSIGCVGLAILYRHRRRAMRDNKVVPRLTLTDSGRVDRIERFSQYVARQMGFGDKSECPQLCNLASDYLRKTKGSEDNIYAYFSNDPNAASLYGKLIEELDRCILAYFAFHWSHACEIISQVLCVDSETKPKLKRMIMAATRQQRFARVTKDLKVTRLFSTLLEELKAIRGDPSRTDDVMVPAARSERSPVLLLMGGGMGAGKSTVLKDILNESFWAGAEGDAVVVEADAFKETDVIYRALSSNHHDMLQTAELVHQSSTDAASSLLVTALNEGRDVIMDGTLSWEPFVFQTIEMARNIHRYRYRMGVGYKVADDRSITENYWEQVEEIEEQDRKRKPYRIELVGVVCDPYLAVARGMRRAIMIGRAVRVNSQLKSHKRFASAFHRYCQVVDKARLYCTNVMGSSPKLIGWKDGDSGLLVDPKEIDCLKRLTMLNEEANSVHELYPCAELASGSPLNWNDIMFAPSRASIQSELKAAVLKTENSELQQFH